MNNLLRTYRLPLALATGFLVLAMQLSGGSSAFARGSTVREVTQSTSAGALSDIVQLADPANVTSHDSYNWGGNEATGSRGTYRLAQVEFKIPTITDPPSSVGDRVSLWTGVGGDPRYGGASAELVQAGITSYIDSSGGQYNFAFYEYVGAEGTVIEQHIHFNQGLNAGDKIDVMVSSNYLNSGSTFIQITDKRTNETESPSAAAEAQIPFSDSATGECIAERNIPAPLAHYNPSPSATPDTVWLNDCVISNNQGTAHPVGNNGWPDNWYRIIQNNCDPTTTSCRLIERIGAADSNGSTPLIFVARD